MPRQEPPKESGFSFRVRPVIPRAAHGHLFNRGGACLTLIGRKIFSAAHKRTMASAVGLFAAGAVAGYFAHYARRAWWPQGEVVLSDSEEELEDDDGREGEDDAAAPASEECKMVRACWRINLLPRCLASAPT